MIYLIASIIIIIINIVPAFMPPTWTIVSFFYIRYEVNLFILASVASISSSFGRFVLARTSTKVVPHLFNKRTISNLNFIGSKIKKNPIRIFLIAIIWAVSPIASNALFISAGFSKVKVKWLIVGFFLGRLLSYFFLAYTSKIIVEGLEGIFAEGIVDWKRIIIQVISILSVFLYLAIDWESLLTEKRLKLNFVIFKKRSK